MKMTAKESMQALLDGKTLEGDDPWYLIKLDDEGNLVVHDASLKEGEFKAAYTLINHMDRVHEEYPLTFKEALKAMLDGKTVESEDSKRRYHLMNAYGFPETFVQVGDESCTTILTEIKLSEQVGKWKVVE